MASYAVSFKRTPRSHKRQWRSVGDGTWNESDARSYARTMSENVCDVEIWLWANDETVVGIYINGKVI